MNKLMLSVDDGCASDIRVAELAKKYHIETIFYWPVEWHSLAYANGYKPLSFNEAVDISVDFEIGSHTITHRHLTKISIADAKYEIEASAGMLENMLRPDLLHITKFAAPRGYTNQELTDYTLKHYKSQRLTKGKGLVHIHPNSGVNDNKPWRECIDENTTEIWGHSFEFDRYNLWEELEEVMHENSNR